MDPVSSIHNKLTDKLSVIRRCLEFVELGGHVLRSGNILRNDLEELSIGYNLATIDALTKYYRVMAGNRTATVAETASTRSMDPDIAILDRMMDGVVDAKTAMQEISTITLPELAESARYELVTSEQAIDQYLAAIQTENFPAKIDDLNLRLTSDLKRVRDAREPVSNPRPADAKSNRQLFAVDKISMSLDAQIRELENSRSTVIAIWAKTSKFENCKACGERMQVFPSASELRCGICGRVKPLLGTVFEDHQFYNQEGQKTKHGEYVPNRHFKFWMDRIQAKEHHVFPQEKLLIIEAHIARFYPPPYRLTCATMRSILKETRLTTYNDHIPLLLKTFTGQAPPQLTHNELRVFSLKFNKIIELYEKLFPDGNRPYYPYFIYKIAEDEFKDKPLKRKILDYIHLQAEDTVKKNDLIYKNICAIAPKDAGLTYRETDTTEAQQRF